MSKKYSFQSIGNFPGLSVPLGYDFRDKEYTVSVLISYMLNRCQSMFRWEGLPDTIPQRSLELYLQSYGNCCITRVQGDLYALVGGLGGEPDPYYMPTVYTVSNPALKYSANLKIGKECVVIPNDSMYMGLLPMFRRYSALMAENELTMQIADINTRLVSLISAPDDRTKAAAEHYIKRITDGELGVIAENGFLDGVRVQPYAGTGQGNQITQLIELQQYLKASWFNELGLQSNYNMKREAINSNESQMNEDALLPLVDNMLLCRQQAAEIINAMYGTNISVCLASAWEEEEEDTAQEEEDTAQEEEDTAQEEEEENERNTA